MTQIHHTHLFETLIDDQDSINILNLKFRITQIQDRFMRAAMSPESTSEDHRVLAEMIAWSITADSLLSSLRIDVIAAQDGNRMKALECVSIIHDQIKEAEEKLNRIDADVEV
jgi:hypothetical protein